MLNIISTKKKKLYMKVHSSFSITAPNFKLAYSRFITKQIVIHQTMKSYAKKKKKKQVIDI